MCDFLKKKHYYGCICSDCVNGPISFAIEFQKFKEISESYRLFLANYFIDMRARLDLTYFKNIETCDSVRKNNYLNAIEKIEDFEKSLVPVDISYEKEELLKTSVHDPNVLINGERIVSKIFNFKSIFIIHDNCILIIVDAYVGHKRFRYAADHNIIDLPTFGVRDVQYSVSYDIYSKIKRDQDFLVHSRSINNKDNKLIIRQSGALNKFDCLVGLNQITNVKIYIYDYGNITNLTLKE